ncbi:MAG: hypothetical protein IJ097_01970 [Bacilli bacterium]|nr:hypothetical protein [Bacilli bacterium]
MRSKKTYVFLILIIVIFFIIMFLLFGLDGLRKEKYSTTIVVGENATWGFKNKKWTNISTYEDLNWEKFHVYTNNVEIGNYYLWHNDKWYVFNDKKEAVILDGEMIAYKANHNISIKEFNQQSIDDYTYVYQELDNKGISTTSKYTADYKVLFDFDSDGVEEEFYVITNAFPTGFNPDKIFSLVFMVKDDKIYPIYEDVLKNKSFNGCKPYFNSFIDVDDDNKYEIILSCAEYSVSKTKVMLYTMENQEFKTLISN